MTNAPSFNERSIQNHVNFIALLTFQQFDYFLIDYSVEVVLAYAFGESAYYASCVAFLVVFD
jgi:hypothetical protein